MMISNQAVAIEQDVKLIQRLFLAPGKAHSMTAFSPVEQGSGASWVISRTARALARNIPRQKVCVVDADFRSPSLHQNLGINGAKGLGQVILESVPIRAVTQQITGTNLWVLPAGTTSAEPYSLLLSDVMHAALEELRQEFDHVLIDTPPAAVYGDAMLVARWTDGVVLVINAGSTRQETAIRARDDLEAAEIAVLGGVLNKRSFPIPETLYRRL